MYWFMIQNRKLLVHDGEQKNMLIHDAKQNLTHSFLTDVALQHLQRVEIRISIYSRKKKNIITKYKQKYMHFTD